MLNSPSVTIVGDDQAFCSSTDPLADYVGGTSFSYINTQPMVAHIMELPVPDLNKTQEEEIYGGIYKTELKPFDKILVEPSTQSPVSVLIINETNDLVGRQVIQGESEVLVNVPEGNYKVIFYKNTSFGINTLEIQDGTEFIIKCDLHNYATFATCRIEDVARGETYAAQFGILLNVSEELDKMKRISAFAKVVGNFPEAIRFMKNQLNQLQTSPIVIDFVTQLAQENPDLVELTVRTSRIFKKSRIISKVASPMPAMEKIGSEVAKGVEKAQTKFGKHIVYGDLLMVGGINLY
jgi:hypothetical protein